MHILDLRARYLAARRLGLWPRLLRHAPLPAHRAPGLTPASSPGAVTAAQAIYERQVADFREKTRDLGYRGLDQFYWYHTIDLGNGLITPGDYDFRDSLDSFHFPEDLRGMSVLDIGSATGFFAFEFERRGAQVVSVEVPCLSDWDMLIAERDEAIRQLVAWHKADTAEEAYWRHLDGPFQFCHAQLGSKITRCYSPIYDLTPKRLGRSKFDLIVVGDLLLHLLSPFKALDVLASLCQGTMISTIDSSASSDKPYMMFLGLLSERTDRRSWWMPNQACVEAMFKRLGFNNVSKVGRYSGLARRAWIPYSRDVIHASRSGASLTGP